MESPIIARDLSGGLHELRAMPHPGALVSLADATMTRLMTTDVALELVFQLLRAVEHTRGRKPRV